MTDVTETRRRLPLSVRLRIGADYLDGEKLAALSARYETPESSIHSIVRWLGITPRTRITNRGLARQGKPRMSRRWL